MRKLVLFLIWFISASNGVAQEGVVELSTNMFQSHQRLSLATLNEWVFKEGNDPNWANPELNTSGWTVFNPAELSADMEDESGRIEGWFRIKITLDSTFEGMPLALSRDLWAATDIYINGELFHSFGDTGEPYTVYNPNLKYPIPVDLIVGKEYIIAIHFVDYETTFTQRELRLKPIYLQNFINFTGPEYIKHVTKDIKQTHIFGTLSISISFLLFFLFWFLVFLNPNQKIFQWVAWFTTLTLLASIGSFYTYFYDLSYNEEKLRFFITISLQPISSVFGLLILEWVLTKSISGFLKILVAAILITNTLAHLFSISLPFGIVFVIMLGYYVLLLYRHKNTISGAQWALVIAVIFPIITATIYITIHKYSLDLFNEYDKLMSSFLVLGAPLFLLAYVSIRFRETLDNVTQEANKVLKVTEEKKELLLNQNLLLEQQVNERTLELKKSLEELEAAQEQLIQQEKLASLGQLTAGIAHEIKNPLNFVNNFSELSMELIEEAREEIQSERAKSKSEKLDEALEILNDIEHNLNMIHKHGSRADSIVKSMLEHSRGSSGKKEPIQFNLLVKEFVNLSYHGMRAGNHTINVDIEFNFDDSIKEVNIIPENFSRVVVNLCNNAFDAMWEKLSETEQVKGEKYSPKLTVRTKIIEDTVRLEIEDNGSGIPEEIKNKIMQPFFTTKKGTDGTGLGLSITNDIIKAHGGKLEVESKENQYTLFRVSLT